MHSHAYTQPAVVTQFSLARGLFPAELQDTRRQLRSDMHTYTCTITHTHTHNTNLYTHTLQISIVDSKDLKGVLKSLTAEDADSGKFVPIAALECRGLEPVGYTPEVRLCSGDISTTGSTRATHTQQGRIYTTGSYIHNRVVHKTGVVHTQQGHTYTTGSYIHNRVIHTQQSRTYTTELYM